MTKRLTESQIVGILKEEEAGMPVPEVCQAWCRPEHILQMAFEIWRNSGIRASRVAHYLDQIAALRCYPRQVRVDNGPEFTMCEFTACAEAHGIHIDYTKPGSPYQNGYIERFNLTYREDVLDLYLFKNLDEVERATLTLGGLVQQPKTVATHR